MKFMETDAPEKIRQEVGSKLVGTVAHNGSVKGMPLTEVVYRFREEWNEELQKYVRALGHVDSLSLVLSLGEFVRVGSTLEGEVRVFPVVDQRNDFLFYVIDRTKPKHPDIEEMIRERPPTIRIGFEHCNGQLTAPTPNPPTIRIGFEHCDGQLTAPTPNPPLNCHNYQASSSSSTIQPQPSITPESFSEVFTPITGRFPSTNCLPNPPPTFPSSPQHGDGEDLSRNQRTCFEATQPPTKWECTRMDWDHLPGPERHYLEDQRDLIIGRVAQTPPIKKFSGFGDTPPRKSNSSFAASFNLGSTAKTNRRTTSYAGYSGQLLTTNRQHRVWPTGAGEKTAVKTYAEERHEIISRPSQSSHAS